MEFYGLLNYGLVLLTFIGIYSLLSLGLNIQWGFAGLFNAGIAGFFAIGAYANAIITSPPLEQYIGGFALPLVMGWLGAIVLSALAALIVGLACLKLRSDYLAIGTIGIAEVIRLVIRSEGWLTNGAFGITRVPRPLEFLYQYAPDDTNSQYLMQQVVFLAVVLFFVITVYILLQRAAFSPWGRMQKAIRDNELAARAMGKNVSRSRLEAFVVGCVIMGLAGALYSQFARGITPDAIDPMQITFLVWVMLILGGSGNNTGAVLGAFVIWSVFSMSELMTDKLPTEYAVQAKYLRMFLVGLLLQVVLRLRPEGILPAK